MNENKEVSSIIDTIEKIVKKAGSESATTNEVLHLTQAALNLSHVAGMLSELTKKSEKT